MNIPTLTPDDTIIYRLDGHDRICFVNDAWKAAAICFGVPELGSSVLGTSLWQHIGSREVAQVYHDLLIHIRATRQGAQFPYRCDCPEWLRDMEMEVLPLEDQIVEFRSAALAVKPIATTSHMHLPECRVDLIRVCSWCRSVATHTGWIAIGDAVEQLDLFRLLSAPPTSHGICPRCEARIMADDETSC